MRTCTQPVINVVRRGPVSIPEQGHAGQSLLGEPTAWFPSRHRLLVLGNDGEKPSDGTTETRLQRVPGARDEPMTGASWAGVVNEPVCPYQESRSPGPLVKVAGRTAKGKAGNACAAPQNTPSAWPRC